MPIIVGRGRSSVEIDGDALVATDRLLRDALPATLAAMENQASAILARARERWPVKSGRSAASLRMFTRLIPAQDWVEVSMEPTEVYARFILSTKVGRRDLQVKPRSPIVSEIRTPVKEKKPEITEAIREALARDIAGHLR